MIYQSVNHSNFTCMTEQRIKK